MLSDELPECEPPTADDELVVRAKMDRTAFSLLYDRYYPRVWQKKYRVIYAELTVNDSDTAPKIDGAQKIEKASKTSKPAQH